MVSTVPTYKSGQTYEVDKRPKGADVEIGAIFRLPSGEMWIVAAARGVGKRYERYTPPSEQEAFWVPGSYWQAPTMVGEEVTVDWSELTTWNAGNVAKTVSRFLPRLTIQNVGGTGLSMTVQASAYNDAINLLDDFRPEITNQGLLLRWIPNRLHTLEVIFSENVRVDQLQVTLDTDASGDLAFSRFSLDTYHSPTAEVPRWEDIGDSNVLRGGRSSSIEIVSIEKQTFTVQARPEMIGFAASGVVVPGATYASALFQGWKIRTAPAGTVYRVAWDQANSQWLGIPLTPGEDQLVLEDQNRQTGWHRIAQPGRIVTDMNQPPDVYNDETQGFIANQSLWGMTNDTYRICTDATVNQAQWKHINTTGVHHLTLDGWISPSPSLNSSLGPTGLYVQEGDQRFIRHNAERARYEIFPGTSVENPVLEMLNSGLVEIFSQDLRFKVKSQADDMNTGYHLIVKALLGDGEFEVGFTDPPNAVTRSNVPPDIDEDIVPDWQLHFEDTATGVSLWSWVEFGGKYRLIQIPLGYQIVNSELTPVLTLDKPEPPVTFPIFNPDDRSQFISSINWNDDGVIISPSFFSGSWPWRRRVAGVWQTDYQSSGQFDFTITDNTAGIDGVRVWWPGNDPDVDPHVVESLRP